MKQKQRPKSTTGKKEKKEIKVGTRPTYMDKLNRKQCNAILRARSSMLMVKENYKKQYESNLLCRFCDNYNETQEHILQDCTKIKRSKEKIIYSKIFEEDTEPLREIANEIIKIEECLKEHQLHSMSSSNRSEPRMTWAHAQILLLLPSFGTRVGPPVYRRMEMLFGTRVDHMTHPGTQWLRGACVPGPPGQIETSMIFSCLRLRQWPVTYLITHSDWIMSCQPGRHAVVTVCEPDWKHKLAAYKSFDETSSFNNL